MPRKPSLTKQIATKLGTDDKTKQLQVIDQLLRTAEVVPTSVTVLLTAAGIDLAVASPVRVTAAQMKAILQAGVDEVTKQIVLYEEERKVQEQLQDYADENPEREVFDSEGKPVKPSK